MQFSSASIDLHASTHAIRKGLTDSVMRWKLSCVAALTSLLLTDSSKGTTAPTALVRSRCTGGTVKGIRSKDTGEPGFQCSCGDTLIRLRCWKDPENRHWAEMLTHWLSEHDPTRQMGRP